MTVSTVTTLGDTAQQLLAAVLTTLEATAAGPPELAFVSFFQPSLDSQCDQAVVFCSGIGEAATAPLSPPLAPARRVGRGRVNQATLEVLVARCVTIAADSQGGYQPPTADQETANGLTIMEDGWALWNGLTHAVRADGLFGGPLTPVYFDGVTPLPAAGGLAGWKATFRVALDGIPE